MENITSYPLQWPLDYPRTKSPVVSRFGEWNNKPSIAKSREFVQLELDRMGAKNMIISSNLKLRRDGLPYSNQKRPDDCGIAIYFTYKDEQMVLACDSYTNPGCNIWAIGKTISAMRGIERWGCSEILARAFTGFKALPESTGNGSPVFYQGCNDKDSIKSRFRELVVKYHPDTGSNPDVDLFNQVIEQKSIAMSKI